MFRRRSADLSKNIRMPLEGYKMNPSRFLNKLTIVFGETGQGKSKIITDIAKSVSPFIGQIYVVSPTDPQNHTFDGQNSDPEPPGWTNEDRIDPGICPKAAIHTSLTDEFLTHLWARQSEFVNKYTKVNQPEILKRLFERCAGERALSGAKIINAKLSKITAEMHAAEMSKRAMYGSMRKEVEDMLIKFYKEEINSHVDVFSSVELSNEESQTLKFLNFNPNTLLIFDDCSDVLKKFKTHPTICKLFTQGRWALMTTIMGLHSDKSLEPEQKKNANTIFYASAKVANSYFLRQSSSMTKADIQKGQRACSEAFVANTIGHPLFYQKLMYATEIDTYYTYTATLHPKFRVGSPSFRSFCLMLLQKNGGELPSRYL